MGDPSGIGPELCLKLLENKDVYNFCNPVIFGNSAILNLAAKKLNLNADLSVIPHEEWQKLDRNLDDINIIDIGDFDQNSLAVGKISKKSGEASYRYIDEAIIAARKNKVDAITTCPINKYSINMAGCKLPGHTEIFAEKTSSKKYCMMQYSSEITASFVTSHVGLKEACSMITEERIIQVIELTSSALNSINDSKPKDIVVCGLNPHSGENGLFGENEEEKIIIPAIEKAISMGYKVKGPSVPDTAFIPEKRKTTGAYICMYHDQGHIPLKALAFDEAVNITLGLPIIRTSVDHGTAFDIAWKGLANVNSLIKATELASKMCSLK
ncbi:MAG: 4-hydroxythreonine-4-phosphate dehydrogenase PdxA [Verrucomicrobiales bacterium]|nr:4-hydroxythreonine-4-phosphate dehydrogenase PdxA [Verrucomicrobiales bacterium]